jgi:hypothetical protein
MLDLQEPAHSLRDPALRLWAPEGYPNVFAPSGCTAAYLCARDDHRCDPALEALVHQLDGSDIDDAAVVDHVAVALLRCGNAGALVVRGTAARAVGRPPIGDTWALEVRIGDGQDAALLVLEHGGVSVPDDGQRRDGRVLCTVGRDARAARDGGRALAGATSGPVEHGAARAGVAALVIDGATMTATPGLRVRLAPGARPVVVQTRAGRGCADAR